MTTTYVAYGLQLRCAFELAGMTARTEGSLPSISLERRSPRDLDSTWSGAAGPVEWQGVLGDGCRLTIERGLSGDLLFTYEDRARFRLDRGRATLDCAPSETGLHWQQVLLGRILPNVALEMGHEALHASAVESPEGVVAVVAPSGMGKTTLATELMRRGWPLFTDDVLTMTADANGVHAHPGTPLMNVAVNAADDIEPDILGTTVAVLSGERWLAAANTTAGERPVRMVCLFERGPDLPLDLQRLPASPLPLAPYMLGLADDPERERGRFLLYADLVGAAELVKITCDTGDRPSEVADLLACALRSSSSHALTSECAS
jgi:hypothetical protein